MTLNDLERRNSPYFAFFSRNLTDFPVDYITVVQYRPIMSVKYHLPVPVFYFWPKLYRTLQRGLSAIAEHLVYIAFLSDYSRLYVVPKLPEKAALGPSFTGVNPNFSCLFSNLLPNRLMNPSL